MTQQQIIKNYLTDEWMPSFDLEKVNTKWGWLGTSASRRARELAETGEIDRKLSGKYVYYRKNQYANKFRQYNESEIVTFD